MVWCPTRPSGKGARPAPYSRPAPCQGRPQQNRFAGRRLEAQARSCKAPLAPQERLVDVPEQHGPDRTRVAARSSISTADPERDRCDFWKPVETKAAAARPAPVRNPFSQSPAATNWTPSSGTNQGSTSASSRHTWAHVRVDVSCAASRLHADIGSEGEVDVTGRTNSRIFRSSPNMDLLRRQPSCFADAWPQRSAGALLVCIDDDPNRLRGCC